ncbi:MAG: aromatic amino acid lyase [Oleiphilaceae bacterium]|nr:aromatic amino acid lyase [Oleiphilaceae bacterium]
MRATTLITLARAQRVPEAWQPDDTPALAGHLSLSKLIHSETPPAIYGANRLVGHLDGTELEAEDIARFQLHLIESHRIGGPPWMSDWQVRCVTYAKLAALNSGGSTISRPLYKQILRCATADDFAPSLPVNASYSAGDVIPAAHWAHGVINHENYLQQQSLDIKEGLSLINGTFVHLGQALSLLPRVERLVANSLGLSRLFADITGCGPLASHWRAVDPTDGPLAACWRFLGHSQTPDGDRQESVSVRAAPQLADALISALRQFAGELDTHINRPADNPLISDHPLAAISQASFLAPRLTVATAGLIETLMLTGWGNVQRAQYLLSGYVPGIPAQAVEPDRPLGLIQVPKRMMAELETLRLNTGRRAFASGGATSEGIEDLWSHGMAANRQLETALEAAESIMALEFALLAWCEERFTQTANVPPALKAIVGGTEFQTMAIKALAVLQTAPFTQASRLTRQLALE